MKVACPAVAGHPPRQRLRGALGSVDQHMLEEYLTGIRDLERRMQEEKDWLRKPRPKVTAIQFGKEQGLDPDKADLEYRRYQRFMFDVIALALQTDSTRVVAYLARMDGQDGTGAWRERGNPYGYHEMTHHGEDPDKLKWFTRADVWYMEEWAYFLNKLKAVKEGEGTLLDHTLVAYGSSGGSVNAHDNRHLPTMLAGGTWGFGFGDTRTEKSTRGRRQTSQVPGEPSRQFAWVLDPGGTDTPGR